MNLRFNSIMLSALTALAAIFITFAPASEARADSWFSLSGGASYNFFYDNPTSHEFRGDVIWMGGLVDIHPEYHFTDWFALGIDLGVGGQRAKNKQWADYRWLDRSSAFASEALLTFRFGIPFESLDLWLELGAGAYMLSGNYINEENEVTDFAYYWDFRGLIGMTFKLNESVGVGFHLGASYMLFNGVMANGGLHFRYRF